MSRYLDLVHAQKAQKASGTPQPEALMTLTALPAQVLYALEKLEGRIVSIKPIEGPADRKRRRAVKLELYRRMFNVVGLKTSDDQLAAYREYMAMPGQSCLSCCGKCTAWTLPFVPHDCPARRKPKRLPDLPPPRFMVTPADANGLHPWPADKLGGSQYRGRR